jgi:hypothetical protein
VKLKSKQTFAFHSLLLFLFSTFFSLNSFSKVDLDQSLFSAFGGGCQSIGGHTTVALGQTAHLKKIIQSIQEDPSCNEWANSLEGILQQGGQIYYPSSPHSLDLLERQISDLGIVLEQENNPVIAQILATELANKKIESINLGLHNKQSLWKSRTDTLSQLNQLAFSLNSNLKSSSKCFQKYPALALQMGGHILGSANSFDITKTLIGSGLIGMGTLTQFLIDLIQSLKFQKTLRRLEHSSLAQALSCSLEGLSQTYCHAHETFKRIKEVAKNRINRFDENWVGISLLKNMNLYNSWISHVTAGSPAGNLIHAYRKKMVIELRSVYEKSKEDINAHIKEAQDEIKNSPSTQEEAIKRRLIKSLVFIVGPSPEKSKSSPYINSFPENFNCGPLFYYYSPQSERNPTLPPMTTCENYIRSLKLPVPKVRTIEKKSHQLLLEGQQYVDIRFSLVKEVDPETVLLEGEKEGKHGLLSPIKNLKKSMSYLKNLSQTYPDEIPPNTQYVISQTAHIIQKSLQIFDKRENSDLSNLPTEEKSKAQASQKLEGIQKLLAPEMKTSYLEERLKNIVRFEIRKKIEKGDLPKLVKELILLSWNDEIRDLEDLVNIDLESKRHDVQTAMRLSLINLESMGTLFNKALKRVFRQLVRDEKKYRGEKSSTALIERLCALSLSLPQLGQWDRKWGQHFIFKYCKGRALSSIYNPEKIHVRFNAHSNKPFHERACLYYNYMKRNKIYRLLGKKDISDKK